MFHPNHHGSLPNHNTATALIQLYNIWIEAAENDLLTAALLLDLSAAFDLVSHDILMKKLALYAFDEETIKFFKEYLENRKQVVQVDSQRSEPKDVGTNGVPQGSILGVLIFLIGQNDFPENSDDHCESVLYVDDDTDNISDENINNLEERIQRQATKSTQWIRDNNMVCSGDKTKLLIIATREQRNRKILPLNKKVKITVAGEEVEESTDEKLLGVIISNDMTWKTHLYGNGLTGDDKIVGLTTQLSQRVGILAKLKKVMTKTQFKKVCEGIFDSKLAYCLQVFGNVWGISNMDETNRRFSAFTKEDNRRLQV